VVLVLRLTDPNLSEPFLKRCGLRITLNIRESSGRVELTLVSFHQIKPGQTATSLVAVFVALRLAANYHYYYYLPVMTVVTVSRSAHPARKPMHLQEEHAFFIIYS